MNRFLARGYTRWHPAGDAGHLAPASGLSCIVAVGSLGIVLGAEPGIYMRAHHRQSGGQGLSLVGGWSSLEALPFSGQGLDRSCLAIKNVLDAFFAAQIPCLV